MRYRGASRQFKLDADGIRIGCLWNGNSTGIQFEFYADGFKAIVGNVQEGCDGAAGHFRKKASG